MALDTGTTAAPKLHAPTAADLKKAIRMAVEYETTHVDAGSTYLSLDFEHLPCVQDALRVEYAGWCRRKGLIDAVTIEQAYGVGAGHDITDAVKNAVQNVTMMCEADANAYEAAVTTDTQMTHNKRCIDSLAIGDIEVNLPREWVTGASVAAEVFDAHIQLLPEELNVSEFDESAVAYIIEHGERLHRLRAYVSDIGTWFVYVDLAAFHEEILRRMNE